LAGYDVIVNVQGDEPFVQPAAIMGAAELVRLGRFALATAAAPADPGVLDRPEVVKVVCDDRGRAMYFSRAAVPHLRDERAGELRDAMVRQHIGIYAYTRDALRSWVALPVHDLERIESLEQLRPLAAGMAMGVHQLDSVPPGGGGVDTEEDLVRANNMWKDLYSGHR
jgi:3-deoxy-manno-octulosonate cytidylyltransferase (CMP-KDO synthetase)